MLREGLEAAGLIRQDGNAYRLTDAGRTWACKRGLDTDDRDAAKHARCCQDGTEKRPHIGGRLGKSILARLVDDGHIRMGEGRVLIVDELGQLLTALLPERKT